MALMVGVSGVRGLIGETLTPQVALEFALSYGTLLHGGRVVLARDTRPSGEMYACAAAAGLIAAGCEMTDLGVAMTPTVGHAIRTGGYAGGMSITASHNPPEWNGLKFLDQNGVAPAPASASQIADVWRARRWEVQRAGFAPLMRDVDAGRRHADAVLAAREVDLSPLHGVRVVLDSINGAGCLISPAFLRQLGCEVVHLNAEPTGAFAHMPEPIAENLTQLCDAVRQQRAGVGFAQDPDADRLAIVDENGTFIGEEYTLALCVWSVLARRPGPVAANLSTSRMVDDVAARFACEVIRTAVGEANVAAAMMQHKCVIGGEGNGGAIDPRICWVRDSLSAMSLVLQLMAATGKSLSQLVDELPRYAMVKQKIECDSRAAIEAATQKVAQAFAGERLSTADGTRVDFSEGWVHIRASNTEPIVRVMGEATDARVAAKLIERVRSAAGV